MLNTTKLTALANDPTFTPAVADLLDELASTPPDDHRESLRAAQLVVGSGGWGLPAQHQLELIEAIGFAITSA
jgi:hypothetical protein